MAFMGELDSQPAGNDTFTWPQRDGLNWPRSTTLGEPDWDAQGDRIGAYPSFGSGWHAPPGRSVGDPI
jgi:hypothetical protein